MSEQNQTSETDKTNQTDNTQTVFICLDRVNIGNIVVDMTAMSFDDRVKLFKAVGHDNYNICDNQIMFAINGTEDITKEQVEESICSELGTIIYQIGYVPNIKLCYSHDEELINQLRALLPTQDTQETQETNELQYQ